jgi:hypothetical protein
MGITTGFVDRMLRTMPRTAEPEYDYARWLHVADNGIEKGLNANAVWRLHEKVARRQHYDDAPYDLGGES